MYCCLHPHCTLTALCHMDSPYQNVIATSHLTLPLTWPVSLRKPRTALSLTAQEEHATASQHLQRGHMLMCSLTHSIIPHTPHEAYNMTLNKIHILVPCQQEQCCRRGEVCQWRQHLVMGPEEGRRQALSPALLIIPCAWHILI